MGSAPLVFLGTMLARVLPRRVGYWLAQRVARLIAARRAQLFCTLRANLVHVVGPQTTNAQLDVLTERALAHAGRTYLDMFRVSARDYRQGRIRVRTDPQQWQATMKGMLAGRGTILVGPHMSNFDLAAQWIAAQGIEMLGLGLAEPNWGTRVLHWVRRQRGITIVPINIHSLRQAMERLKRGGVVFTGVDRPISRDDEPILFFDAPAPLPTGHIRLALQTGARILVACCVQDTEGQYAIRMSPLLEMEVSGNRAEDIHHNARRVLAFIEEVIRSAPQQWLMFVPVWDSPDAS